MKVLLTGYGSKQPTGEPQPFKSMRLEIDLAQGKAISEGVIVHKGTKGRQRSLMLKGRTRKVNREAFNNDVSVHLHDLSPGEALILATRLIRFAHDSYTGRDRWRWTLDCTSEREQLLYEMFNTSCDGEDEDCREYLVPLDELLQIVGYVEHSARLKSESQEAYQDPMFAERLTEEQRNLIEKNGEQGKATLRIMSMLRRFYSAQDDEQRVRLVVVGSEDD